MAGQANRCECTTGLALRTTLNILQMCISSLVCGLLLEAFASLSSTNNAITFINWLHYSQKWIRRGDWKLQKLRTFLNLNAIRVRFTFVLRTLFEVVKLTWELRE